MAKLRVHFPGHEWHGKVVEFVAGDDIEAAPPDSVTSMIVRQVLVRAPNGETRWFHPNHLKAHA